MARKIYHRSDETYEVLSKGNEADIAREMEKDVSHINRIKNGNYADPYSPFRALFRAAVYADAPAEIWLNDLAAILARARKSTPDAETELTMQLVEKIRRDGETQTSIVEALKDRTLDRAECHEILACLERNEENTKNLTEIVRSRLGDLSEKSFKERGETLWT